MKFESVRFDIQPKRDEYQQTSRHILPILALWADGKRYRQIGFAIGWWKWQWNFFFKEKPSPKIDTNEPTD